MKSTNAIVTLSHTFYEMNQNDYTIRFLNNNSISLCESRVFNTEKDKEASTLEKKKRGKTDSCHLINTTTIGGLMRFDGKGGGKKWGLPMKKKKL